MTWQHICVILVLIKASVPAWGYQEKQGSLVFVLQPQSISDHLYGEFLKSLEPVSAVSPLPPSA